MSILLFSNNASTTLASGINSGATTVTLAVGTGALFPSPSAGQIFVATFVDAATGLDNEIVHVTGVSGDVMTIVRAQEGTTAQAWLAGDLFNNFWTAGSANAMLQQGQQQQQATNYAVDSGSANALVITLSPAPTSMTQLVGAPLRVKVAHTNTTNAPTLNVNGLGAQNIVLTGSGGSVGVPINTLGINKIVDLIWDGTNFQYQDQIASATTAIVQAGTDILNPITASALAGAMAQARFSTTGYQTFPSGIIIQWGTEVSSTGDDTISLPVAFPNHFVSIVASVLGGGNTNMVQVGPLSASTFEANTNRWNGTTWVQTAGITVYWAAFGY